MPPHSKTRRSIERETEELRAEIETLRASEAKYRRLHETRIDAFVRVSMDGRIQEVNELFQRMVGYDEEELLSLTSRDLTPERWHAFEAEIVETQVLARGQSERYEKEYRRKDGTVFPVEARTFVIRDLAGDAPMGLASAVRDITERKRGEQALHESEEKFKLKQSEQHLRDLSVRLMSAQDAERSRLARELHDDFSQRLALLAVNLHLLRQSLPDAAEDSRAAVTDLYAQVQALARDMRRMSHDLHPARLEQLGLESAMRGLCGEVSAAHGLPIRFDARDVARDVPEAVAVCLYRVAQEALQNVVKHSGASTAMVDLAACLGELRLVVTDDGCGFDPAAQQRKDSLGLSSIRERVRSIGGRFAIDSGPGRGTRIEVHAPSGVPGPATA